MWGAGSGAVLGCWRFCKTTRCWGAMQFGVLVQLLFRDAVWGAVGGALARAVCCALRGGVLLEVLVCNIGLAGVIDMMILHSMTCMSSDKFDIFGN